MSNLTSLVADVETMIAKWGIEKIRKTLDYVSMFPESSGNVVFNVSNGQNFMIDPEQLVTLRRMYGNGNKIQTIKLYREIFGCGLKEAKEAIEYLFENGYKPSQY